jgi:hypothetical protein
MDEYFRRGDPYHESGKCVYQFRGPLTVEQFEDEVTKRYDLIRKDRGLPSNFDSGRPRWMELKDKYREGDRLYACFATDEYGLSGSYWYLLVRGHTVIALHAM